MIKELKRPIDKPIKFDQEDYVREVFCSGKFKLTEEDRELFKIARLFFEGSSSHKNDGEDKDKI